MKKASKIFHSYTNPFSDIDECATSPCQNSGSCTDQINGYSCSCAAGYDGANCENGNIAVSFQIFYKYQVYLSIMT